MAHELPDIFCRIELRTFWRQRSDAHILGHFELPAHVLSGMIHQKHAADALLDNERYFRQVQ